VHVGRNVDVLKQRFLRGQFESGFQAIGQQINQSKGAKYFTLSKTQ